ncbi:MAG: hypothetical protein A2571_00475 [Candidatus Vogelbacteria bacterium RIFOXYD1_FULL_44_32]|uniref:Amino acid aminotransferase n=1 Tax=Candidatus Vogelbacteria bacterium RIFOXYD1_FULL_44_32 TaxID=1802438 RepID=A0A1G2QEA6_9BACT|nr:MAG: hypothetical protein A2571_00475 [Candidatus Vogelbacteria bacterium RIFOXYD1_FULL_44_32]
MSPYCYANNKIVKLTETKVLANDLAVLRGYGVFDFARIYNKTPFHLEDHFVRFCQSAKLLGLKVPVELNTVLKATANLLVKNKLKDASVRLVLTGGASDDGISLGKSQFFILMDKLTDYSPDVFTKGAKLITVQHARPLAEAKHTNYAVAVKWQEKRQKAGAIEILYVDNGKILECAMSNFGIFKGNTLITPKNDILAGVTRKIVLKLARKKFKVEERELLVSELADADEAFLTATNKYVVPIVKIDNLKIGNGKVGPNTKWLLAEFKKEIDKICYKNKK